MSDEDREATEGTKREAVKLRPVMELSYLLTLRVEEAAALSNLSVRHITDSIKRRKLKTITVGGRPRIKRAELDRFIDSL